MAGILHQQINLKKTGPDTYNAAWHQDWTVASSMLEHPIAPHSNPHSVPLKPTECLDKN